MGIGRALFVVGFIKVLLAHTICCDITYDTLQIINDCWIQNSNAARQATIQLEIAYNLDPGELTPMQIARSPTMLADEWMKAYFRFNHTPLHNEATSKKINSVFNETLDNEALGPTGKAALSLTDKEALSPTDKGALSSIGNAGPVSNKTLNASITEANNTRIEHTKIMVKWFVIFPTIAYSCFFTQVLLIMFLGATYKASTKEYEPVIINEMNTSAQYRIIAEKKQYSFVFLIAISAIQTQLLVCLGWFVMGIAALSTSLQLGVCTSIAIITLLQNSIFSELARYSKKMPKIATAKVFYMMNRIVCCAKNSYTENYMRDAMYALKVAKLMEAAVASVLIFFVLRLQYVESTVHTHSGSYPGARKLLYEPYEKLAPKPGSTKEDTIVAEYPALCITMFVLLWALGTLVIFSMHYFGCKRVRNRGATSVHTLLFVGSLLYGCIVALVVSSIIQYKVDKAKNYNTNTWQEVQFVNIVCAVAGLTIGIVNEFIRCRNVQCENGIPLEIANEVHISPGMFIVKNSDFTLLIGRYCQCIGAFMFVVIVETILAATDQQTLRAESFVSALTVALVMTAVAIMFSGQSSITTYTRRPNEVELEALNG